MNAEGESAVAALPPAGAEQEEPGKHAPAATAPRASAPRGRPFGKTKTPLRHEVAEKTIALLAMATVVAIALIFLFIGREAFPLFWEHDAVEEVPVETLFAPRAWRGYDEPEYVWQPVGDAPKYNVVPLFVGTLEVTLLAMLFSIPLGVASALFLAPYASRRLREIVEPVIEPLAASPPVVRGFFALMVLATWAQDAFGFDFRLNAVVAAMGLSLAIIPVIFTISEDAIQAVPNHL